MVMCCDSIRRERPSEYLVTVRPILEVGKRRIDRRRVERSPRWDPDDCTTPGFRVFGPTRRARREIEEYDGPSWDDC